MEPVIDCRIYNGPPLGTHCVINRQPHPTRLEILKVFNLLNSPTLHLNHFFLSFSHFLPFQLPAFLILFSINWSTPLPQIPKSPFYWSESAAVFLLLVDECLTFLFFSSCQVCVSDLCWVFALWSNFVWPRLRVPQIALLKLEKFVF